MKYITGSLFSLLLSFSAHAIDFESMAISGYDKKVISETQIRFSQKDSKKAIHLQISQYDPGNMWKQETLKADVEKMFEVRKDMYDIFGFSDVNFYTFELEKLGVLPRLDIFGTYKKINNKKVYFSETNLYFNKKFLQVKIINEAETASGKIQKSEIENILRQIKAQELEVNQ